MGERRCMTCGKLIPEGESGNVCALCRVGLVPPAGRMVWEAPGSGPEVVDDGAPHGEQEFSDSVDGRQLTGLNCPECAAVLTINDLRNRQCSVCDARLGRDLFRRGVPPARSRRFSDQSSSSVEVVDYPLDATFW